jgi:hypothetical protein
MPDEEHEKPDWDKSKPGTHPAIAAPVTQEEIQAALNTRKYLTREDIFLLDSQDAITHNSANLVTALAHGVNPTPYRLALAIALTNCGKFDEALKVIRRRKGFDELAKRIRELRKAIDCEDAAPHDCPRKRHTTPHHLTGNEAEIELPRRQDVGMVYSAKHGKVVHVWQCSICQHLNAHDLGPPENQQHLYAHRSREEAKIIAAQRKGVKVHASMVEHHETLSDHHLLKPTNG